MSDSRRTLTSDSLTTVWLYRPDGASRQHHVAIHTWYPKRGVGGGASSAYALDDRERVCLLGGELAQLVAVGSA
jgi:hypothetical protein